MSWGPWIVSLVAALAVTPAVAREGDSPPTIEVTAEVVTVDRVGVHLVDRSGGFWVVQGQAASGLRLPRGTMVTVEGVRLPDVSPPTEQRIQGQRFKIMQDRAVHPRPIEAAVGATFKVDGNAPVLLKGAITSMEWRAKIHLHMAVEQTGKPTQRWMVEVVDPQMFMRAGQGPETLKPGVQVIVRGYQSLDKACAPECRAFGRDVTIPDGRKVYMNGGSGAPRDGVDPTKVQSAPPAEPLEADEFDPVTIRGQVVSADWSQPHVQLHLVDETGQHWRIEGGTRNTMLRGGMTPDSLKPGRRIIVNGFRATEKACIQECLAVGREVTFPDGIRISALP